MIKLCGSRHRDRHKEQDQRIESSKTNHHIFRQKRVPRSVHGEGIVFSINNTGKAGYSHAKE